MKKDNDRFPIIEFLFNKENNKEKTEEELEKILKSYNSAENLIKGKKKKKFPQKIKKHLLEYFNNINNKESFFKIFNEESINFIYDYLNQKIALYTKSDYICSIPYYIINKSNFEFHTNEKGKEPYIVYEKINYGFFNFQIEYNDIKLIKEDDNFKNCKDQNLIDIYNKLLNFLEQVEDKLKKKFKYYYKLKISLDLKMEKKKNDDKEYNVTCIYIFSDPIKNEKSQFKEDNIFVNGTKSEGFKNLLSAINNESFKEVKYP
jgi:hypothetical protein